MWKQRLILAVISILVPAVSSGIEPEGIVFQAEAISTPHSAWLDNRSDDTHWNLWTKEQDIDKKRSGGAVLASPAVKADRATAEEGAPPLHSVVPGLKPGWYRVFAGSPGGRPLAYSRDGREWFKHQGGELSLGIWLSADKPFELWVDDRYAYPPGNPGPGYYDYLRFVPCEPPAIENIETFSGEPGKASVCWTTNVPLATGWVELVDGPAADAENASAELARNHQVLLDGLDPRRTYRARVVTGLGTSQLASAEFALRAAPPECRTAREFSIPLSVPEPGKSPRSAWPATVGIPFPRGALGSVSDLRLVTLDGKPVTLQAEVFSRWPDGSVKWAILSFLTDTTRDGRPGLRLEVVPGGPGGDAIPAAEPLLQVAPASEGLQLRTAWASVDLDRRTCLEVVDGEGRVWVCGEPDLPGVAVESNGPVRAVVRLAGPLRPADGSAAESEWGYLARLTFYRGQPLAEVDVSLWCDPPDAGFGTLRSWTVRIPRPGSAAEKADGQTQFEIVQDRDDRCVYQPTAPIAPDPKQGPGTVHFPSSNGPLTVSLGDLRQLYPIGYRAGPSGVEVLLLPPLATDAYADAESRPWQARLYTSFQDGKYVIRSGQLIRRRFFVRFGTCDDVTSMASWLEHRLLPQAPAEYLCSTGVLGRELPAAGPQWADFEAWFQRNFERYEKNCAENRSLGVMHYGDWFGERGLNYGNNEYDLAWGLAVQWMRTGHRPYFDRGLAMALHYSSIDTLHGRAAQTARGLCWEHSFNHVGTPREPDELLSLGDRQVQQYLELYGRSMLRGAIDPQGHIYQEGNWICAALTGDRFLHDVAQRVCGHQASRLTVNYNFGIERAGGWPLINAAGAYRHSGDPFYLNAARIMIQRCLERQDPQTGGWLHQPPLSETDGEKVLGGKAFAVGILSNGILRYLDVEPLDRPDVRRMVVRGADWLMQEAWNPGKGFRYISNSAKYRDAGDRGVSCLLNAELAAAAYEFTGDEKYADFCRELIRDQFAGTQNGMGKTFAMSIRQTIFGLDRLQRALSPR